LIVALSCGAFASALPAGAALQPVRRNFGSGFTLPLVRAGRVHIPAGHASGRVRVIARLQLPPLAAVFAERTPAVAGAARHLDVASAASRAYLAKVSAAQARAAAALKRAIPAARIGWRYKILLDGFAVSLPYRQLPKLAKLGFVTKVYPSYTYTEELNRSPSLIGADVLQRVAGADGRGIKIGVVDDGIDQTNPFFDASGFSYPAGFPRGGLKWVSPKVIVARVFPGPNSGAGGRLAVDPQESFHGTHVAGIAAGDSNTTAPAGADHPTVTGLTGIAPKAWLGNYRVFTVPTPIGNVANTPEIVEAFESAVSDGMNVINFSGGGAQTDPANDAMNETIRNVVNAGVVPVIAAGNDRDDFGTGSAGSPGTAPDAISVAAVSNTHVFSPALSVTTPSAPDSLRQIPFIGTGGPPPASWGAADQRLVDVGSIMGTDGKPVERHLCGPPGNLALPEGTLPRGSLSGSIALVQRGLCPFVTKTLMAQAAGAIGVVFVDNRQGEANPIPALMPLPSGMISNLDGQRLVAFLSGSGGSAPIRIGRDVQEILTGRGGTITSFSSAGPTAFGHLLKPDLSAPGGQILSSTLPHVDPSGFAVFDGTSMATPHVAGAAALLLQLHPSWTPAEVKSALMTTAGPAWGDTAMTQEAGVPLEGAGLANLPRAADPQLFTEPSSLSFGDLDTNHGPASDGLLVRVTDAGDGAGTWNVQLAPQSTTPGTSIDTPASITVLPGGEADLAVVAHASDQAPRGEDYGFVVLTNGTTTRRIPYLFIVTRPSLELEQAVPLHAFQTGDTRVGLNRVETYRYPTAPFGNAPDQPPMDEDGAEHLYRFDVNEPVTNFGVAVWEQSPGARIDPWVLGAPSEDQVQGDAGTPVNVNSLMVDYLVPLGAAGAAMPRQQAFYVSVDSGRELYTGRSLAGSYLLHAWLNDNEPPLVRPLTTRVAAGRSTVAVDAVDLGAGVDPYSLVLAFGNSEIGASFYDPQSGLTVFRIASPSPKLRPGKLQAVILASDYQESKNVNTIGDNPMPNTTFLPVRLNVVRGTAESWVTPPAGECVATRQPLVVAVSTTATLKRVRFFDGKRAIGTDSNPTGDVAQVTWKTGKAKRGRHVLTARATDSAGHVASARRTVRVCR
jgi:subtilisin family serine protease